MFFKYNSTTSPPSSKTCYFDHQTGMPIILELNEILCYTEIPTETKLLSSNFSKNNYFIYTISDTFQLNAVFPFVNPNTDMAVYGNNLQVVFHFRRGQTQK